MANYASFPIGTRGERGKETTRFRICFDNTVANLSVLPTLAQCPQPLALGLPVMSYIHSIKCCLSMATNHTSLAFAYFGPAQRQSSLDGDFCCVDVQRYGSCVECLYLFLPRAPPFFPWWLYMAWVYSSPAFVWSFDFPGECAKTTMINATILVGYNTKM